MGVSLQQYTCETVTMASMRQIRFFISSLLLICIFHEGIALEFCEDRSTTIENGYVKCTLHYDSYYTVMRCQIECVPGYVAHPLAQITCTSSGSTVLTIDSNGKRSYVYTGTWNRNVTTAACRVPTTCAAFGNPRHGSKTCSTKGDSQTCLITCQYPYEVSEPIHQREHCGPQTNFFWSHVIRRNSTVVPPCVLPQKCRALQDTDFPEHGEMICRYEPWFATTICKLECERGYLPTENNKKEVFCGPTTAFIWSHVHEHRNSYIRIQGCKQSPITTEVTITVGKPCRNISKSEKEEDAKKLNVYLRSEVLHLDENSTFSFIGWKNYCTEKVIETVVKEDRVSTAREDPRAQNMVLLNPGEGHSGFISLDVNLSYPLDSQDATVSPTSNPPTASTEVAVETETAKNEKIVNVTISELTYSLYYKALCTTGQCKEACRVLNMTQYQLCLDICMSKVRTFLNAQKNQVKILQTMHVGKLMAKVNFPTDVTAAWSDIVGAKFKSLNVTTIPLETQNVTEHQAGQMKQRSLSYWRSRGSRDSC